RTQAVDVSAALHGRDQIDVALLYQLAFREPGERSVDAATAVALQVLHEQFFGQAGRAWQFGFQVGGQAVFVMPFLAFATGLIEQPHGQTRTQYGFRAQQVFQFRQRDLRRVEIFRIGQETQCRAGRALRYFAQHFQLAQGFAVCETHAVFAAIAADGHLEVRRQCVDHGYAHAVQAAGEAVVALVEFAARMQARQDQFHAADAFLRVDVHRHAAAVVGHFHRAVAVHDYLDRRGETRQRLVDRIVHDFLDEVIRTAGIGVHAGPAAHRFQAGQHL